MSSDSQPKTLVPTDCDLRDFPFMPVDIMRLFNSEFHALANDAEWRAGMTLWLKSYHQVPAASIPDDDVLLARLAEFGRDVKSWKEVREMALRGWIKCDDGRLYHPVVAEKVLEAWIQKIQQRWRSAKGNAKKYKLSLDEKPFIDALNEASDKLKTISPSSKYIKDYLINATSKDDSDAPGSIQQGDLNGVRNGIQEGLLKGDHEGILQGSQETGTEIYIKPSALITHSSKVLNEVSSENEKLDVGTPATVPNSSHAQPEPTPAARVCRELRNLGFGETNPAHPLLLELLAAGATVDEFVFAGKEAKKKSKDFKYILGIVRGQRTEALAASKQILRGDISNKSPPKKTTPQRENFEEKDYGEIRSL